MLFGLPQTLGAAVTSANVRRLQMALEALSRRVDDHKVATTLDGRLGPLTTAAVNRAMSYVTGAPSSLRTGRLTQQQIADNIGAITSYIESATASANVRTPVASASNQARAAAAAGQAAMTAAYTTSSTMYPQGVPTMYPQSAYYPPSSYPPGYYPPAPAPRGPGGLPTDRATLDVKAFIPAQYQHVRISPGPVIFLLMAGVIVVMLVNKDKKKGGA